MVATPIGNLMDITLRALDVLSQADLIACEDTRVTGKLMAHFGISVPMVTYNDHSGAKARPKILAALADGSRVALVSDAGTPLISDPGYKLIQVCIEDGYPVVPIPGASALLAAAVAAGLPTDQIMFVGFLPAKAKARREALSELASINASLVFYESGPRGAAALKDMTDVLGNRAAAVARELTKLHEEVRRGSLSELAEMMTPDPPKGEMVVIVAPPKPDETLSPDDVDRALKQALKTMSVRDAAATVSEATALAKKDVYSRALALSAEVDGD